MHKIKILRIIARLNIGGPSIHTILLTAGLDKKLFDSLLVCGAIDKDEGDMSYYALQKGIKPFFIPQLKRRINLLNDLIALKKVYHVIKIEKPDIIHTHTAKAGSLGRSAGILYNFLHPSRKIKLVHTFHGHVFSGYFDKISAMIFILIERFLAKFSSKIITVSESVKNELLSFRICPEDKIEVIPLGFELEEFLSIPPKDDSVVNIGIVGRLVRIKNHKLFLQAASIMAKRNPHIRLKFKIIGDGPLKKELQNYAQKLAINGQVYFLGWQEDLARVYSDLDIVALTSINEGTPVSLIEAMASGRAIAATDAGGVKDLLGQDLNIQSDSSGFTVMERGVLVVSQESSDFANALSFILQNRELKRRMEISGRNFTKTHFSKDRLLSDIEQLYDKILIYSNKIV